MHDATSDPSGVRALDVHLRALRAELADLPGPRREEVVDDVRAHVTDAVESGRPLPRVLAGLTPPGAFREELGLPPRGDGAPLVAARATAAGAAVVALATGALVLALHVLSSVPWQAGVGQAQAHDLPPDLLGGSVLAVAPAVVAALAAALLFVPRSFAAGPGTSPRPAAHAASWVAALALSAATAVDLGGSGWWWLPAALLAWAAVVVPRRLRRPPSARRTAVRRWLRATVVLLPVGLCSAGVTASGGVRPVDGWTVFYLAAVAALVVVGVLVGLGSRAGHVALAAAGALVMVLAVVEMGMPVLAVWWSGGVWLLLGLVGLVDGTARSLRRTGARAPSAA